MYIRRRNAEPIRVKRQSKTTKRTEALFSSSFFQYIQILLIWAVTIALDMLLDLRLEFIWPCWLLLRCSIDTYRINGILFAFFFFTLALASDAVMFILIPLHWLLFLGSSLVWLQLAFQADRGICMPSLVLCVIFVYIEVTVRFKEHGRLFPVVTQILKPLAAHCIGYPCVTVGFHIKAYLYDKIAQRNKMRVKDRNQFYFDLINEALPEDQRFRLNVDNYGVAALANGRVPANGHVTVADEEYLERPSTAATAAAVATGALQNKSPNNFIAAFSTTSSASSAATGAGAAVGASSVQHNDTNNHHATVAPSHTPAAATTSSDMHNHPASASSSCGAESSSATGKSNKSKDDFHTRLELENKRLKGDLQVVKSAESDLRAQLQQLTAQDRLNSAEVQRLRVENESLSSRSDKLTSRLQEERNKSIQMEKKWTEEKRNKVSLETQLEKEKKARKEEVEAARLLTQQATAQIASAKNDCSDACKQRRREVDSEVKNLRRDNRLKEEKIHGLEMELDHLRSIANMHKDVLSSRDSLRDQQLHLSEKLREENLFRQDLLTAYHEAIAIKIQLENKINQLESDNMHLRNFLNSMFTNTNQNAFPSVGSDSNNAGVGGGSNNTHNSGSLQYHSCLHGSSGGGANRIDLCSSPTGLAGPATSNNNSSSSCISPGAVVAPALYAPHNGGTYYKCGSTATIGNNSNNATGVSAAAAESLLNNGHVSVGGGAAYSQAQSKSSSAATSNNILSSSSSSCEAAGGGVHPK